MEFLVTVLLAIALLSGSVPASAAKLPDNFPRCKKGVNEDECVGDAVQKALPIMKNGIPSLQFLPVDPMEITHVSIQEGGNRPVNVRLDVYNSKLYGISDIIVNEAKSDLRNRHIQTKISVPLLRLEGDYEMNGKFLLLPLQGKGKCKMTLGPYKTVMKLDAVPKKKENEIYWDLTSLTLDIYDVKNFTVDFQNLFNGDKLLGESTNKVLNENWDAFFEELKPAFAQTFGEVFRRVANVIFSKVPEKDLFLD